MVSGTENRDSGVADVEVCPCQCPCAQNQSIQAEGAVEDNTHDTQIKRSALSNSLLDIHEQCKCFIDYHLILLTSGAYKIIYSTSIGIRGINYKYILEKNTFQ